MKKESCEYLKGEMGCTCKYGGKTSGNCLLKEYLVLCSTYILAKESEKLKKGYNQQFKKIKQITEENKKLQSNLVALHKTNVDLEKENSILNDHAGYCLKCRFLEKCDKLPCEYFSIKICCSTCNYENTPTCDICIDYEKWEMTDDDKKRIEKRGSKSSR